MKKNKYIDIHKCHNIQLTGKYYLRFSNIDAIVFDDCGYSLKAIEKNNYGLAEGEYIVYFPDRDKINKFSDLNKIKTLFKNLYEKE